MATYICDILINRTILKLLKLAINFLSFSATNNTLYGILKLTTLLNRRSTTSSLISQREKREEGNGSTSRKETEPIPMRTKLELSTVPLVNFLVGLNFY